MIQKIAKLSLATSIALVSMSSLSAKDLSEAIKGVDVSGTVVYRYNDYGNGDAASDTENNYKIGISISSPVNEDVKANTRFIMGAENGGFAGLDTNDDGDENVEVRLSHVNFQYTGLQNTSIFVGKQGLNTAWTKATDSDAFEQTGTGVFATSTFGAVTAAAGMYNQTNLDTLKVYNDGAGITLLDGSQDVIVAALMGNMGPVSAEAWYIDIDDIADSYFVKASAKFNLSDVKLKLYAQYNDMDIENDIAAEDDHNLLKAGISAKMGLFNASFAYAKSGDNGTGVINKYAKNGMVGWNTSIDDHYDAKMYQVDLGMKVTDTLHIGLNYDSLETADAVDKDEKDLFVQATYKMSKNFKSYVRFGNYEQENTNPEKDGTRGRLQLEYSF